jgi:23S rRNA pseudouridine2605 synthase
VTTGGEATPPVVTAHDDVARHDAAKGGEAPQPPRLQKVLAAAGVASRRKCEELISAGRVEVDGDVVTQLGARVDPERAVIRVDSRRIPVAAAHVYLVANKPRGVVSTMSDEASRPDLSALVADRPERLFHVGRLDTDTDGLIVLTNDGEFAHRLAHPSFELRKTYVADVDGVVKPGLRSRLLRGVELEDGPVKVDDFRVMQTQASRSLVEVVLHEGRNHIVRRLLASVGHPVLRLSRTAIGPIRLRGLKSGDVRQLDTDELGALLDSVGL